MKACPCFDVIPWAKERGLPVVDIRGTWKPIILEMDSAPVLEGPNTRTAYLQRLLMRGGYVLGPIDGIAGRKTARRREGVSACLRDRPVRRVRRGDRIPPAGDLRSQVCG